MDPGDESRRGGARICEVCFEQIPDDQPMVRAARQLDVSLGNPRAGRIDGSVIRCDERCWRTLSLSGVYRRLPDDE